MTFSSLLSLELGKTFKSIFTYLSLIVAMIFGSGIIVSITLYSGPFDNGNLIGVYATLSLLFLVVISMKNILVDLHYKTHYFYFTSARRRIDYFLARLIINGTMGILFALGGVGLLAINWSLNGLAFGAVDAALLIGEYLLFAVFFTSVFFLITLFYQNVMNLAIVFLVLYLIVPSMFGAMMQIPNLPGWVYKTLELIPFYSVPMYVPTVDMSLMQGLISVGFVLAVCLFIVFKFPKVDY
ncbi:hypothetical protein [Planococcus maitriensis]|uniref:Uncharacterized protein n=1 Tax=Planococcus maitriensis TaxID=221799 RepID=A0A365K3Y8_9BACL|nr:hypothetical protein [Planococcus maitriensis]RAZ67285.1 hypothetical protein DP119_11000 [Planococcus maitriensis]